MFTTTDANQLASPTAQSAVGGLSDPIRSADRMLESLVLPAATSAAVPQPTLDPFQAGLGSFLNYVIGSMVGAGPNSAVPEKPVRSAIFSAPATTRKSTASSNSFERSLSPLDLLSNFETTQSSALFNAPLELLG